MDLPLDPIGNCMNYTMDVPRVKFEPNFHNKKAFNCEVY